MSLVHTTTSTSPDSPAAAADRPDLSHLVRKCDQALPAQNMPRKARRSVFREEGLDDLDHSVHYIGNQRSNPPLAREDEPRERSITLDGKFSIAEHTEEVEHKEEDSQDDESNKKSASPWLSKIKRSPRPKITTAASAPPSTFTSVPRVALLVFLIALVVPGFRYNGGEDIVSVGADAGVIMRTELVETGNTIEGRATSPTDTCTRWSHMTALVNGTLYVYGGESKTTSGQTTDTWNNDFLTLDLTKSWEISSPSLTGLAQPSGPPAVAMGSLWHSYESLFLYGGEFSDSPATSPSPVSTWEYNIKSAAWTEHSAPQTSAGNASDVANQPVQRAAEGAGLSVPELGRSWYFGGHLDLYTTENWSNQIARVYLKSLLEFTHPGYANTGVTSLGSTNAAPAGGVYRNITDGGLQDSAGFTERADGVLVYVPGWGEEGIILGLAGGTNETFTEMNVIDIYDVANSEWYKQSTSGPSPPIRVDPCAVVAGAPDGSSFNVYLYGGQNLIPAGEQIQYSDMWILTIPSFTWIEVDMTGQSEPPARAGHTCDLWNSQMVVVGGYVGQNISCDSPGIYVFNTSSLEWTNSFTSLPGSPFSSGSSSETDVESTVYQDSYGYQVPAAVQSVIGGSSAGGASATTPAAGSATVGPIATGKPPTFTITQSGSTVVSTAKATSTVSGSTGSPGSTPAQAKEASKKSAGLIAAGVIAGLLGLLAAYLAFCTWLYRRRVGIYKDHVAMAQRAAFTGSGSDPHDSWNNVGEANSGTPMTQSTMGGGAAMLGPFGTSSGRQSTSGGRPSLGDSSGSNLTPVTTNPNASVGGIYGAGVMPGPGPSRFGPYGRLSEEIEPDEGYHGAGHLAPSVSTARSSMEDLLGGQEPSFLGVVLNPRRTLRVVNSD